MSAQDCIICDLCLKHEPRPTIFGLHTAETAPAISILPAGWWTFAPPASGIEWSTFCSDGCVYRYLNGERR